MGNQVRFEVVDLAVCAAPVSLAAEIFHPFDQHPAIPGPIEERHPAETREMAPEAPEIRPRRLFVRRLGDRHDADLADVESFGDAANASALAGGIAAFEGDDESTPTELLVADQGREAPLPFFDQPLVVLFVELAGEVEGREECPAIGYSSRLRLDFADGRPLGWRWLLPQAAPDGVQESAGDRDGRIALVGGIYDDPGRIAIAGQSDRLLHHVLRAVVVLQEEAVPFGDTPTCRGITFQLLQPLALLGAREM